MKLLDTLERWIRPVAIPNLTVFLIALQVVVYVMEMLQPGAVASAYLIWNAVAQGEVWRLVTFLAIPPASHPIFLFFAWYIFYLMGTALESYWGTARYNLFILLGVLFTLVASIFAPGWPFANMFLAGTVFLAFAVYNPEFELMVFFVLPVKIKWLALITWVSYGLSFFNGPLERQLEISAAVGNYLMFFGPDMIQRLRRGQVQRQRRSRAVAAAERPRHVCVTCGITNLTHPEMDFRYCSTCVGQCGYCTEHIRNHEHVLTEQANLTSDE